MDRGYGFYRFDFDNYFVLYDQIGTVAGVDADAFVDYRDWLLAGEAESPFGEFAGEDGS